MYLGIFRSLWKKSAIKGPDKRADEERRERGNAGQLELGVEGKDRIRKERLLLFMRGEGMCAKTGGWMVRSKEMPRQKKRCAVVVFLSEVEKKERKAGHSTKKTAVILYFSIYLATTHNRQTDR